MDNPIIKNISNIVMEVITVALIAYFVSYTFFTPVLMQGFSMKGAIEDKNVILVDRLYKRLLPIKRYDIIAYEKDGKENIKRVIGLPGDTVSIQSGVIYVNGERLKEEYEKEALSANIEKTRDVGENEYYVIGDNLDSSKDSRLDEVGNISADYVIGKKWFLVR